MVVVLLLRLVLVVVSREGFWDCLGKRALTMALCQAEEEGTGEGEEERWRQEKSRIG